MTFELLSNISLVQFGSFVGLLNGAYTLYMLLARAKIRLFLADSIGIVHPPREVADRFHLACNFVNARGKVGAVHRLEATVLDPEKNTRRFEWNLFYEYGQRGQELLKTTDPFPIAVLPRSNAFYFIEFKLTKGEQIKYWPQGLYEFNILGWANRRDRKRRPNITATFHIEISNLDRMGLHGTGQDKPIVFRFPIVEWSLQDRRNRKRWWRRFIGS